MAQALIGSQVKMEWQFFSKTDGTTPIDVTTAIVRLYDPNRVQIGTDITLTDDNKAGVGELFYLLTIPNINPYIDVEISVMNSMDDADIARDRIYTIWEEEGVSSPPSVTLTLGTNTYVTLEEAETYMLNELGVDAWKQASPEDRARALIKATKHIDTLNLKGARRTLNQPLEFPRIFLSNDRSFFLQIDAITQLQPYPQKLKDTVCEEAVAVLQEVANPNLRRKLQQDGVTQAQFGDAHEWYNGKGNSASLVISTTAKLLMRQYIDNVVKISRGRE